MMFALAAIGAAIFAWLEWRRPDQRNRAARIGAASLATCALVLIGYFRATPAEPTRKNETEAVLFTGGATSPSAAETSNALRFALPRAGSAEPEIMVIPDVAYLRRHHPEVRHVRVTGSGLEPFELNALEGLRVSIDPQPPLAQPAITFLHVSRRIALGTPVEVQGRVDGLKSGERVEISLEAPEGTKASTSVTGDSGATAQFRLSTAAPAAEGRFVWRLSMARGGESARVITEERIGVSVVKPSLPRVLALDGAPRIETAHLQRWFAEMGGSFRSRTLVGAGRYRFASTIEGAADFATMDAELLANVEIVILDRRALAGLSSDERGAIRAAVSENGMGLLVVPGGEGSTLEDLERIEQRDFFLPWKFVDAPASEGAADDVRSARLTWAELTAPLEQPIPLDRIGVELAGGQRELVRDTQGRAAVASTRRGRGEVALSLARDTWRWQLADNREAFAGFWSFVLSKLAKADSSDSWRITDEATAPLLVNRPVELCYSTTAATVRPAEVTSQHAADRATLPLAQDRDEPTTWRTTFWPRHAGWHRVSAAGGAQLDFFVHEADEWASLAPARQRQATQLYAALATPQEPAVSLPQRSRNVSGAMPVALFALFLLSSSYLWLERRRLL